MSIKMKTVPLVSLVSLFAGIVCAADVQENWTKNCAACHGKDGKGETKAGKKADVKDLTDANYQASLARLGRDGSEEPARLSNRVAVVWESGEPKPALKGEGAGFCQASPLCRNQHSTD